MLFFHCGARSDSSRLFLDGSLNDAANAACRPPRPTLKAGVFRKEPVMRTPMTNVACVVMMSLAAAMAFVSARAETPVKSDLTVSADLEQGKTGPQIQVPPIQVPPIVEPNPDLSGDGIIGTDDLIMLLTHWGA